LGLGINRNKGVLETEFTRENGGLSFAFRIRERNPLSYTDPTGLVTMLSKIYVQGYCGIYCVAGMMGNGMLQLYMTGGRGPGFGGGGGGGGSGTTAHSKQAKCTAARQAAAQLAKSLEHVSHVSGILGALSGVGTFVAVAGEGPTFGFDTPVTVTFGSMTAYFGTAATVTGVFAAGLNSFAGGNLSAINSFNVSHLVGLGASAASSKIPGISGLQEVIAGLSEQAASVVAKAKEACQ